MDFLVVDPFFTFSRKILFFSGIFEQKEQRCKAVFSGLAKNGKIGNFHGREKSPLRGQILGKFFCNFAKFTKFLKFFVKNKCAVWKLRPFLPK